MTNHMKEHEHTRDTVTFGFWVYLMSDCLIFAGLFATYAVLRHATYGAASIGTIVNLPFVLVETLLLLTSSFTAGLAVLAAHRKAKTQTLVALLATLVLGVSFLKMEMIEFARLVADGSGPSHSAFLSAFFTLLGTHGLHVFVGAVWMIALMVYIARRGVTEGAYRKLLCLSMFWHFLDIVWIFIFTFVYLFGSL